MKSFFENKFVNLIWLVSLLLFPIILWLLPSTFFDEGKLELCPSKLFFDVECFGCGISRAVMHFHHLEFDSAAYYNPLVFGVYPFLIFLWVVWNKAAWRIVQQGFFSK